MNSISLGSWPYRVVCGTCEKEYPLRVDAKTAGRVSYFEKTHFKKCEAARIRSRTKGKANDIGKLFKKLNEKPYNDDEVMCPDPPPPADIPPTSDPSNTQDPDLGFDL